MPSNEFICECCGGTFRKKRSDEDAEREAIGIFGMSPKRDDMAVVCDPCFWSLIAPIPTH